MGVAFLELEELQVIYDELYHNPYWKENFPPTYELPEEDSEPLEDSWHRYQMNLLIECIKTGKTDKENFYVGGNMFIYFMNKQVERIGYKGPDFFYVKDVKDPKKYRGKWVVWEEDWKYPNVIIELLSPTTMREDLVAKKELYEKIFQTPEYYCFDFEEPKLYGWRLTSGKYQELTLDDKGFMESKELGFKLGIWRGKFQEKWNTYLRFFDADYKLIPTYGEIAEHEKQRADKLEQELLELKKKMGL